MRPPKLSARFELDKEGRPQFIESDGKRHFKINIDLEDAPAEIVSATYRLDSSFWDPVREVFRGEGGSFRESITSYGDFDVVASISGSSIAGDSMRTQLSDALQQTYRKNPSGDSLSINDAIDHLRKA